jgi:hypothetical protein
MGVVAECPKLCGRGGIVEALAVDAAKMLVADKAATAIVKH